MEERNNEGREGDQGREPEESREGDEPTGGSKDFPTRGVAPSSGDLDHLERIEPSEEAKAAEPSDVDAMGQDKRREVIGHSYGPSRRGQLLAFGSFFAAVAIIFVGGKMIADKADEPPETNPDKAPWSQPDAPQRPGERPE